MDLLSVNCGTKARLSSIDAARAVDGHRGQGLAGRATHCARDGRWMWRRRREQPAAAACQRLAGWYLGGNGSDLRHPHTRTRLRNRRALFQRQWRHKRGVYYVGQFTVDKNTINADIDAIAMQNSHYPDGATWGTGTLGGQIVERTAIDGGVMINTDPAPPAEGHAYSNSLSLTFSSQYNRASSLATIAGSYGPSSLALTISADGVLSAQDAGTGCVINGTVATIDPRFNMYAVTLSTMNCAAEFGVPDGAQLKGLATLNNSQSPDYVMIGAADTVSATKSALTITMNRM